MQYQVVIINNSRSFGDVCLFKKTSKSTKDQWRSLAWQSQILNPEAKRVISWNEDYAFFWSNTGVLEPGEKCFSPHLMESNKHETIRLVVDEEGAHFSELMSSPIDGMEIQIGKNIPAGEISSGIAINNKPCFIQLAEPMTTQTIYTKPDYYINFGNFEESTILGEEEMKGAVRIHFPPNIYTVYAVYNADRSWSIGLNEPSYAQVS